MVAEVGPLMSVGGASQKETLAVHGRQALKKGVLEGWHVEEALEVVAWDSNPLQDLPVPEKH